MSSEPTFGKPVALITSQFTTIAMEQATRIGESIGNKNVFCAAAGFNTEADVQGIHKEFQPVTVVGSYTPNVKQALADLLLSEYAKKTAIKYGLFNTQPGGMDKFVHSKVDKMRKCLEKARGVLSQLGTTEDVTVSMEGLNKLERVIEWFARPETLLIDDQKTWNAEFDAQLDHHMRGGVASDNLDLATFGVVVFGVKPTHWAAIRAVDPNNDQRWWTKIFGAMSAIKGSTADPETAVVALTGLIDPALRTDACRKLQAAVDSYYIAATDNERKKALSSLNRVTCIVEDEEMDDHAAMTLCWMVSDMFTDYYNRLGNAHAYVQMIALLPGGVHSKTNKATDETGKEQPISVTLTTYDFSDLEYAVVKRGCSCLYDPESRNHPALAKIFPTLVKIVESVTNPL